MKKNKPMVIPQCAQKKAALISVFDKTGVKEFAEEVYRSGYIVLSTGGTYDILRTHFTSMGLDCTNLQRIEDYTHSKEFFDGRVKTLHPKIYMGILARGNVQDDISELARHDAVSIDLVAVNLYPFQEKIQNRKIPLKKAIEYIDIGGVTLLRAAAKNFEHTITVSSPEDYAFALRLLATENSSHTKKSKDTCRAHKLHLASKTFSLTSYYDSLITSYLQSQLSQHTSASLDTGMNETEKSGATPNGSSAVVPTRHKTFAYDTHAYLRYGENPHQRAVLYSRAWPPPPKDSLIRARVLHGKPMSYNNYRDAESAVLIVKELLPITKDGDVVAVGVKHGNPCGVAIARTPSQAWTKCFSADSLSIFGGIVAFSKPVDLPTARHLSKVFLEVIIAPEYDPEAFKILAKKKNIRLLSLPFHLLRARTDNIPHTTTKISAISGGILLQDIDNKTVTADQLVCATKKKPTARQVQQLLFAWQVCKHVKSNAIVVAKNFVTAGIGAGQMNRVGAAQIALERTQQLGIIDGAVLASDAFFPMSDTVMLAAQYGIKAIIQPGGSIKDQESIDACIANNIAMVFTGVRHFLH